MFHVAIDIVERAVLNVFGLFSRILVSFDALTTILGLLFIYILVRRFFNGHTAGSDKVKKRGD